MGDAVDGANTNNQQHTKHTEGMGNTEGKRKNNFGFIQRYNRLYHREDDKINYIVLVFYTCVSELKNNNIFNSTVYRVEITLVLLIILILNL